MKQDELILNMVTKEGIATELFRQKNEVEDIKRCPFCGSSEIIRMFIDENWTGAGGFSYAIVNPLCCYRKETIVDLEKRNGDFAGDMWIDYCENCRHVIDGYYGRKYRYDFKTVFVQKNQLEVRINTSTSS